MKFFILTFLASIISSGLFGQTLCYDKGGKKKKVSEIITLTISPQPQEKGKNKKALVPAGAIVATIAGILPTVIEQGSKIYKNILSNREAKFTGEYKANSSESGFWADSNKACIPTLTLKREVTLSDSDKPDELNTASEFTFVPELSSDSTAFRYKLSSYLLIYSKAKVNSRSNKLNVKIDIKFTAIEKSEDKHFVKADKGVNSIMAYGISFSKDTTDQRQPLGGNLYSGWFPLIANSNPKSSNGNYEMEVSIAEINPANIKPKRIKEFLENYSEPISSITKVIIEKSFNKQDDEEEQTEEEK